MCWCTLVERERLGSAQQTSPTKSFGVAWCKMVQVQGLNVLGVNNLFESVSCIVFASLSHFELK